MEEKDLKKHNEDISDVKCDDELQSCAGGNCSATFNLEELEEKVRYLQDELDKTYDTNVRLLAEMENLKHRTKNEIELKVKQSVQSFALDLLPVIDTLEQVISTSRDLDVDTKVQEGFDLFYKNFIKSFQNNGITIVTSTDENGEPVPADPKYHQIITAEESNLKANVITQVLQNGYMLFDTVLRSAKVAVSKG
ncbi:MAG: nucleotide exchange factor GrpE [Alphaproteobacteria bacterium]|nr:nucleotide exchange factor GrpE [Alphaproteobacteria bacterium]MBL0717716.1 nucleotide exchange factor GrpE [Alphaproteobacteria bacterium]